MSGENVEGLELAHAYPLLWGEAQRYDFAERLGGCSDPLLKEINDVLHELWLARRAARNTEGEQS